MSERLTLLTLDEPQAQTLAANGAVTLDAEEGKYFAVTLKANATSSVITNPTLGQEITIAWIQDSTGSRTYTWPTNCKFAGGTAPTGGTASKQYSVKFIYNGTNWVETARAEAVG